MNNSLGWFRWLGAMLVSGLAGCVDAYEPKVSASETNLVVVDGSISSEGVTSIKLARTVSVGSTRTGAVESKAQVYVEEASGRRYGLKEGPAGTYTSAALTLAAEQPVRLHFTLAGGGEYASDYTSVKATPPIDSVSWRVGSQGLQVYVNTHDATDRTRYYRWSYDETWEFTSAYQSFFEYKNGAIVNRTTNIYQCWGNTTPSTILLGTTTRLGQNLISEQPITLMPPTSDKLRTKYSILVRQYALSAEEYAYWEALRKNTESLGTLFDALPTQLTGNVHNVARADEPVLGFVGAQSVQQQRIFIERRQLPASWKPITGYEKCSIDAIPQPFSGPINYQEILDFFKTGEAIPIVETPGGYLYSTVKCMDCRQRGSNMRPSFWR